MRFSLTAVILVICPHNEAGFLPSRRPENSALCSRRAVSRFDAGKNAKRELLD